MSNIFLRVISLCSICLFFSGVSNSESLIIHNGGPQWRLGVGINQVTGEPAGTCVASTESDPAGDQNDLAQEITVEEVTSYNDVRKYLELGAYASVFGFGTSLKANVFDSSSSISSHDRVQFIMKVAVAGKLRTLKSFKPSEDAIALLADTSGKLFASACGDAMVVEIETGAALFVSLSYESSSSEIKSDLIAGMKAAWAGQEVGANLNRRLSNYSKDLKFKVTFDQIGLGSISTPSLDNPALLMEYGRTFARSVALRPAETRFLRAHYKTYDRIPPFLRAKTAANASLLKFNNSVDVMKDLVDAYQRARDFQRIAAAALSNPDEFEGDDAVPARRSVLQQYQQTVAQQVNSYSSLAKACVAKIESGSLCDNAANLDVEPLPKIRRIPACVLTAVEATSNDGCKARARVNGSCRCTRCQFLSEPSSNLQTGVPVTRVCSGMPTGSQVRITYAGLQKLPDASMTVGQGKFKFGKNPEVLYENMPNPNPFHGTEKVAVGAEGSVEASMLITACIPSPCKYEQGTGRTHIFDIAVEP